MAAVSRFPSGPKRPEKALEHGPPARRGLSTSVALKASHLHKMAERLERERKDALKAKGASNATYDGTAPAEGLSLTDPELSVLAPVQSSPGQRSVSLTRNVINQFAVAANARYSPRPVEPREAAHLFVSDVMSAQNTTLGRAFPVGFAGSFRPGSLAEIWKWLSETALSRGWRAVEGSALLEASARGLPVIAMARTPSGPRLAVVEPGPPGPDGKPRLASAHEPRGQRQTPEQVFGSSAVRYLAHD